MGETSEEMLCFADQSAAADSDVGLLVFLLLLLSALPFSSLRTRWPFIYAVVKSFLDSTVVKTLAFRSTFSLARSLVRLV